MTASILRLKEKTDLELRSKGRLYLTRAHKDAVTQLASEIGNAVDRAIILSPGVVQLDTNPFSLCKLCRARKAYNTASKLLDLDDGAQWDVGHGRGGG